MSYLTLKVRNVLRGLVQRYATTKIKTQLWDAEFSRGRWGCLDRPPGTCKHPHVEKHANNGSILDLGCGPGSTGNELTEHRYQSYTGVDISDVAIEKAKERAAEHGRADKNQFVRSDILHYVPTQKYDVILFGDSIYYVPRKRIVAVLDRYAKYLKAGGVFIVNLYGINYQAVADIIESNFDVLEKVLADESNVRVLVFPPSVRRRTLSIYTVLNRLRRMGS
jgi:SAM-dependent methyltransferase